MKAHISIEHETTKLNKEIRNYIYILYKIVKPGFNTLVYLIFAHDSLIILRIIISIEVIIISLFIFMMNQLCGSVTNAAHKSQSSLYKTVLSRNQRIPRNIKLKIMRFIERLSGPEIGFYCYDLFAMNSYNFTDYVFDSIVSYLLIIKM